MKSLRNGGVELAFDVTTKTVVLHNKQRTLSSILKLLRVKMGLSLEEMENRSGIPKETIALIENNIYNLTVYQLVKYCDSFTIRLKGISGGM